MKNFLVLCGGCLLSILLLAGAVRAEEVKTPHYTLDLPSEWLVPRPVNTLSNGNAYVIVANKRDGTTVSIGTMSVALPLEELVGKTVRNMQRSGFTTTEKKLSDHTRVVECTMEDGTRAVHYFCVDGNLSSVVSIMGTRLDSGRVLLQEHFKPVNARLFPSSYAEEPPAASPASPASTGQDSPS